MMSSNTKVLTGQLEDDISAFDSPDGDATKLTDGLKYLLR